MLGRGTDLGRGDGDGSGRRRVGAQSVRKGTDLGRGKGEGSGRRRVGAQSVGRGTDLGRWEGGRYGEKSADQGSAIECVAVAVAASKAEDIGSVAETVAVNKASEIRGYGLQQKTHTMTSGALAAGKLLKLYGAHGFRFPKYCRRTGFHCDSSVV